MNIEKRKLWNIPQSTIQKERTTEEIVIGYAIKYHRENEVN